MRIASPRAKILMSQSNKNSKTQKKKREELEKNPRKYIACKVCQATNITLIKAADSYYCKFCFEKLNKKKFDKKGK